LSAPIDRARRPSDNLEPWPTIRSCSPAGCGDDPAGTYRLFRIGDAVASRNIHAAVYDAIRLMKDV